MEQIGHRRRFIPLTPVLNPQPHPAAAANTAAPQVHLAANDVSISHPHIMSHVTQREEFTQRLISQLYTEVPDSQHDGQRVTQQIMNALRINDIPLVILHARLRENSRAVTVLESLLTQPLEEGWCSAIFSNLTQNSYEADITGAMNIIIAAIQVHTRQDEKITPYTKFLMDIASTLFAQQQPQQAFNIHVALQQVVSLLPSSLPLHPLWLSLLRLLCQHGASSSMPNGLGETPMHTLVERTNIDALLAWMVSESDLHVFNLKDVHDHSIHRLPYIRSVYDSALTVQEENPFCTPARLCLEVCTKVIEWQNASRPTSHTQPESKEEVEAMMVDQDGSMMDHESSGPSHQVTSSSPSSSDPFHIQLWLHHLLESLPTLLLSSRLSSAFKAEEVARGENVGVNIYAQAFASGTSASSFFSSSSSSSSFALAASPSTATLHFITSLLSHPAEIHLEECGLIDISLFAHFLSAPHSITHLLSVPTAADLFLWRIDAMSREGLSQYKANCDGAMRILFRDVVLETEEEDDIEQSFTFRLYDAMLAKYVESVEYDHVTGLIPQQQQHSQLQQPKNIESAHWIQTICQNHSWSLGATQHVLSLLRKYHIPHDYISALLNFTSLDDNDRIREYIQLTMSSDFLQPAFCLDGRNIREQSERWLMQKTISNDNYVTSDAVYERVKMIQQACDYVMAVIYPQLRTELEDWMIADLAEITMQYLVPNATHAESKVDLEEEMTRAMNQRSAGRNW